MTERLTREQLLEELNREGYSKTAYAVLLAMCHAASLFSSRVKKVAARFSYVISSSRNGITREELEKACWKLYNNLVPQSPPFCWRLKLLGDGWHVTFIVLRRATSEKKSNVFPRPDLHIKLLRRYLQQ